MSTTTITSPLDLSGNLTRSTLTVNIVHQNEVDFATCTDRVNTQEIEFGFVTPEGLDFSISGSDDELMLEFFPGANYNVYSAGDLPSDMLDVDNIPGFKNYLNQAGLSVDGIMENTVSVTVNRALAGKFKTIYELVEYLTNTIRSAGGNITKASECGPGSEDFDLLADNFKDDINLLDLNK